ncbi:hypothetical protein [Caballeronia zhejiangensis]|uniref:hypothetical protein n=1 Tax=Caballeronia zhejiangensis TaxID=871203 RepID=UPI001EF5177B|nr:hypothetical protein [Caballeronia zhejiangensis]MCG7400588.1 hypothetical protein [Caballeronia zhejiangensis]
MGLWEDLFDFLGLGSGTRTAQTSSAGSPAWQRTARTKEPARTIEAGVVCSGVVEYVNDKFVKVRSGEVVATVFLSELADVFVERATEFVSEGSFVRFVLKEPSSKKPGEWIASLSAVREAEVRARLPEFEQGSDHACRVVDIQDKEVVLDCDGVPAKAPLHELSWSWIDHPSRCVRFGEELNARVLRIEAPDNWLNIKAARKARLIVSIKACVARPESPLVAMPFSAVPFRLWAEARKPRICDTVVMHVLTELALGARPEEIARVTGFNGLALQGILQALEDEALAREGALTRKGKSLIDVMESTRQLNEARLRGLFASAAPQHSQFVAADQSDRHGEYPHAWPRPPAHTRVEDMFMAATDEAVPEPLVNLVADADNRAIVSSLLQDSRVRVFVRKDGLYPRKVVYLRVPEHWVLAGLWFAFDALGEAPFRPVDLSDRCKDLLVVRVRIPSTQADAPAADYYFDPVTGLYWTPRADSKAVIRELKGADFPEMPAFSSDGPGTKPRPPSRYERRWCRVKT